MRSSDSQTSKRGASRLRELMARGEILPLPLIHDALSARIAAHCGYDAVFLSGNGFSSGYLGLPDAGFTSYTDLYLVARSLLTTVSVPVIIDCDTGFGNAISAKRVVRELARAGVAGVLLEDQASPKRSEFVAGVQIIPLDEAVGKVRAAVDARNEVDPDFVLIARTDARVVAGGSLEEAIRRGNAYAEAGADVIFVAAPQSVDEIQTAMRAIRAPAFCPIAGIRPYPSLAVQQSWGMAMTLYGASHRVAAKAVWDFYQAIKTDASAHDALAESLRGHPLATFEDFIGFAELQDEETRYLPPDELQRKYEGSIGFGR
jgi:2-methylisocitrate lyase-like PEP mutase family enzyme